MSSSDTNNEAEAKELNVLVLEDSQDDALLVIRELKKGGFTPQWERAGNASEFISALDREWLDLIIADYRLPEFTALDALKIYNEKELHCPFIVVSGQVGEETAAEVMKAGAGDFILKDNLTRLIPAVKRELAEFRTILENEWLEHRQILTTEILELLNAPGDQEHVIKEILNSFQAFTGAANVALRLKSNENYPFYQAVGAFEAAVDPRIGESDSSGKSADGQTETSMGVTCQQVLDDAVAEDASYFTHGGSFWTNDLASCLSDIKKKYGKDEYLEQFKEAGYASFAMIPLRSQQDIIGGLQVCDFEKDLFAPYVVQFFEELGASIGIALAHQQAEEALEHSEKKLSLHIQQTPLAVVEWDVDRRITNWNAAAERIFSYTNDEVLNKDTADLIVPAEEQEDCEDIWEQLTQNGTGVCQVCNCVTKEGERLITEWFITPLIGRNGMLIAVEAIAQDITEHQRAKKALEESELKFRTFTEAAPAAIMIHQNNQWIYVNPAAERITGYSAKELFEMGVFEIIHPDMREKAQEYARARDEAGAQHAAYETKIIRKDGSEGWVEIQTTPIEHQGEPAVLVCALDTTEGKEAEQRRADIEKQMRRVQKFESLGVLAGGIAHDFNNLLTTILGNAELVMSDLPADSPVRDALNDIIKASTHASSLCREMQEYTGKGESDIEAVNISRLAAEMSEIMQVSVSKYVELQTEFDDLVPAIQLNPSQMRQVIMNLITNASDAIGEQSGTISLKTGSVECTKEDFEDAVIGTQQPPGKYAYVEIQDTGKGIPEEIQQQIFEPFYSTKASTRGLGMAAVAGIIRTYKGVLKLDSEENKGTTFRILFPASDQVAPEQEQETTADPIMKEETQADLAGTVLIVEDENHVLMLGQRVLKKHGFSVLSASDGDKALRILRQKGASIDCVLLDYTAPCKEAKGCIEAMKEIRPDIPIVVASGYTELQMQEDPNTQKASDFVQKPFRTSDLVDTVQKVLPRK